MRRCIICAWTALLLALHLVAASGCGSDRGESTQKEPVVDRAEQQRVRRFWNNYRDATRLRKQGAYDSARAAYTKALLDNKMHADALYNLGNVNLELGSWEEAEASWRRLVEVDSTSLRAYAQLGHLFLCRPDIPLFDVDKAREAFAHIHKHNPEEIGPALRLGETALIEGRFDRASEYFDMVLGTDDKNLEAVFLKAYLAWRRGSAREGFALLGDAIRFLTQDSLSQLPGEGDTRTGSAPALARSAGCPLFDPLVDSLSASSGVLSPERANVYFERLDEVLSGLRARG